MVVLDTHNMTSVAHSNLTGAFPYTAANGDQYIFMMYSWDANAILLECMKSRNDAEMMQVYQTCYEKLERRGIKPTINVMDNEASAEIKRWLGKQNITYQLTSVDNHRTNVAERCIETAKHHIIAGLATTDGDFPIRQWNKLIPQAQHTLNMLRPTRINPRLSAFAFLEGMHSYDAVPFTPPGWKVLVYEDPTRRSSWDPHGIEGWYVAPALENYRNYKC